MKKTGLVFLIMMIFLLVGSADRADTDSLIIPVTEFVPDGNFSTAPGDYIIDHNGSLTGSNSYPCFYAPVKIPAKTTKITRVIVYLQDQGISINNPQFNLYAFPLVFGYQLQVADFFYCRGHCKNSYIVALRICGK
jgi:hypothetical protein